MNSPPFAHEPVGAQAAPRQRWPQWLLSGRGVLAFWVIYCLVHVGLRIVMSSTLSLDDARANEIAVEFALGYQLRQPPLYSWVLWSIQQVVGPGLAGHLTLRYALVALIGLATYGAVLAACDDRRFATAASLSLAFSYPVGWTFHEWANETLVLSIACLVTFQTAIRFLAKPIWASATLLGLAVGLGLMSKFSYPIFLVALAFAIASLPETRRALADKRLLLVVLIAMMMVAPYAWWLIDVRGNLVTMASAHLIEAERPFVLRVLIGLAKLAWSLPAFLMPWLAVVVVLAWPAFARGRQPRIAPLNAERIAWRTMLIGAALMAAGVAMVGATNIAERYMHPVLMIAPAFVFARVARFAPAEPHLRRLLVAAIAVAVALLPARVLFFENEILGGATRPAALPMAELAKNLSERGITEGTLVAGSARVAGNLRQFLPDLRYIAFDSTRTSRPARRASDDRSCVLVWLESEPGRARSMVSPGSDAVERIERIEILAPSMLGRVRRGVWFIARLDSRAAICS